MYRFITEMVNNKGHEKDEARFIVMHALGEERGDGSSEDLLV